MPEVSGEMQVEHAYPLSRSSVNHLLRIFRQKLSIKRNSFVTYAFFLLIFVSLIIFPLF